MELIGNCWPNKEQLLLLKAALAQPKIAFDSWEQWCAQIDIDDVDVFSYQIMPQIYQNLSQTRETFSHQGILKGIYKHTWMNNQILMNHLFKLLSNYSYHAHQPILLMKGGAMLIGFYEHWGCRVIGDLDLLVPKAEFKPFIEYLCHRGFCSDDQSSLARFEQNHWQVPKNSIPFQDKACERPFFLDLHLTPLTEMFVHQRPEPVWFNRFMVHDHQQYRIHSLNSSDLLLQTIIHGTKYSHVPLFRWIMDAVTILNKAGHELQWLDIMVATEQYELVLQMQQALIFLKTHFVPNLEIDRIRTLYVSRFNQQEFRQKSKKSSSLMQVIIHHRFHAKRQNKSMPRFLKDYWNLKYYHQIPLEFFKKTCAFLKRRLAQSRLFK